VWRSCIERLERSWGWWGSDLVGGEIGGNMSRKQKFSQELSKLKSIVSSASCKHATPLGNRSIKKHQTRTYTTSCMWPGSRSSNTTLCSSLVWKKKKRNSRRLISSWANRTSKDNYLDYSLGTFFGSTTSCWTHKKIVRRRKGKKDQCNLMVLVLQHSLLLWRWPKSRVSTNFCQSSGCTLDRSSASF
jgi:hypothetical protein